MKHRVGYNRLGRKASHRKAMMKNMATSLFRYERIETTKAKAKEVRKLAEKILTRAGTDSVHNRRIVAATIGDKEVLAKLFVELGPRYEERPGGYTRIIKNGYRKGDAAEMVILELVDGSGGEEKARAGKKKRSRKSADGVGAPEVAVESPEAQAPEENEKPAEDDKELVGTEDELAEAVETDS